jgi:hypothetical protein
MDGSGAAALLTAGRLAVAAVHAMRGDLLVLAGKVFYTADQTGR